MKEDIKGLKIVRNIASVCFVICFAMFICFIAMKIQGGFPFKNYWVWFGVTLGATIISLILIIWSMNYIFSNDKKEEE